MLRFRLQYCLLVFSIFLLIGCTANPRPVPSADSGLPGGPLPAGRSVVIMDTFKLTTIEGAGTSESPGIAGGPEAATQIGSRLASGGLPMIGLTKLEDSHRFRTAELLATLRENRSLLLSAFRDKRSVLPILRELQQAAGAELLCVSRVQERPGRGGTYDPNSGAIAETTSSFDLKVVLVSLSDGKIVWGNEVYVRQPLNAGSWSQCVNSLFDTTHLIRGNKP